MEKLRLKILNPPKVTTNAAKPQDQRETQMEKGKKKRKKKIKVLYTKQKQWHIDPKVRFIDACVALGLGEIERNSRAQGERHRSRGGDRGR